MSDEGEDPKRPSDPLADVRADDETDRDPDDDPFESIGEGSGPLHGDPFDAFEGAEDSTEDAGDQPTPARDGLPSGPAEEGGADDAAGDPFVEFDEPTTDPFGEGDTVFDRAEGDDGVWEHMESTDPRAEAVPGKRYVDVDKHSYCETCEHFSAPPTVACSHDGTEILEFVDMDTVRVVDCPVVEERKALEDDEQ